METIICDRCKKLIENPPKRKSVFHNPEDKSFGKIELKEGYLPIWSRKLNWGKLGEVDLCVDCFEELKKWLEIK